MVRGACIALVVVVLGGLVAGAPGARADAPITGSEDAAATAYRQLLERHTRWVETTWDAQAGSYAQADYDFVNVLGNAVLLQFGDYDAERTGVSRDVLADHTLRTIRRFAASNRWVDPQGTWGGNIFWDATFEGYFLAAAHLLWDELDPQTHANLDQIAAGEADYVASLGSNEDPRSGGWSSNGLNGGFRSDSKIEEMGAKTMPLATGLAYAPDAASKPAWREWLNRWTLSMTGLPPADAANPTPVDGQPISAWTHAQNIFDTFMVENHGSLAPMYQESAGAYPGRNAAQFVISGRPLPEALRSVPSARELGATLERIGTDAGVAEDFMVADRHHLYGRNILPIAYRSTVLGDPYAARSEQMLIDHLGPYQAYAPADRLTKFSGEAKYEPEARAELAMAYVLHYARARFGGGAEPVSKEAYFAGRSNATDYGADLGVVAQQSPRSLAAAITKPGFVKFAYLPQHDDWLFDVSAGAPALLPSTRLAVTGRTVHVWRKARDGYDATTTVLRTAGGAAGYATLPDGGAVYATTGLGADEGALRVTNLDMPGVPGLDGDRTFTAADGSVTLSAAAAGLGDGGVDDVALPRTTARWVRFLGARPATQYGYSLFALEVRDGGGDDLAHGATATASSFDAVAPPGPFPPSAAVDGNPATRWAVSRSERGRADSWLAVDLGAARTFDHVVLRFDPAYGAEYRIQVSDDGQAWREVASVPDARDLHGSWLNVDGRAGFVVRGSDRPIRVTPTSAVLAAGPATPITVEARPGETPQETAAAAAAPAPTVTAGAAGLRASVAGGYLTLLNLDAQPAQGAQVQLPAQDEPKLFGGSQVLDGDVVTYAADVPASEGRVEAPRFVVERRPAGADAALRITVADSQTVTVENLADHGVAVIMLRSVATGEKVPVEVGAGASRTVSLHSGTRTPSRDLAVTQTTYPTSPLPPGMSDPDLAVDGDPSTSWRPGPDGRMVVDLGAAKALASSTLDWTGGKREPVTVSVSDDGTTYREVGSGDDRIDLGGVTARWVAVQVPGWRPQDAEIAELGIEPAG